VDRLKIVYKARKPCAPRLSSFFVPCSIMERNKEKNIIINYNYKYYKISPLALRCGQQHRKPNGKETIINGKEKNSNTKS